MAQRLLSRVGVGRFLRPIAVLGVLLGWAGPVRAQGDVDSQGESMQNLARARTQIAAKEVATLLDERGRLTTQQAHLQEQYDGELRDIDALKQNRASWYRDRQLRQAMADSLETADTLAAIATKLRLLGVRLKRARGQLLVAIDAEIGSVTVDDRRKRELGRLRREHAAALRPADKKIVLPDERIDPLADPEELDQQVAALAQSERQLEKEIAGLKRQSARFARIDELRQKHERADELEQFDDDQPRRSTGRTGSGRSEGATSADTAAGPETEEPAVPLDGADDTAFDNDPTLVLSDVVDAETIGALRRAEQSDDPLDKATAALLAAKKVEERLRRMRSQRVAIEKRAHMLRGE
jgi:hypothetical protein